MWCWYHRYRFDASASEVRWWPQNVWGFVSLRLMKCQIKTSGGGEVFFNTPSPPTSFDVWQLGWRVDPSFARPKHDPPYIFECINGKGKPSHLSFSSPHSLISLTYLFHFRYLQRVKPEPEAAQASPGMPPPLSSFVFFWVRESHLDSNSI